MWNRGEEGTEGWDSRRSDVGLTEPVGQRQAALLLLHVCPSGDLLLKEDTVAGPKLFQVPHENKNADGLLSFFFFCGVAAVTWQRSFSCSLTLPKASKVFTFAKSSLRSWCICSLQNTRKHTKFVHQNKTKRQNKKTTTPKKQEYLVSLFFFLEFQNNYHVNY